MTCTADNSGHTTSVLRTFVPKLAYFVRPNPFGTSYSPNTLSEMPKPAFEKGGFINIFKVINMEVKS